MDKNKDIRDTKNAYIQKDISLVPSLFLKEPELEFIFKKTDKIITAMYLVTNFFSIDEPLKWDIRQISTKTLRSISSLITASVYDKETRIKNVSAHVVELNTLFEVAYRTGLVSSMNYNILNAELGKLSDAIGAYISGVNVGGGYNVDNLDLSKNSFEVQMSADATGLANRSRENSARSHGTDVLYKGHTKQQSVFYGTVRDLKQKLLSDKTPHVRNVGQNSFKKTSTNSQRRDQIISEISKKGEVSVKDISSVIKDCSEKTLQRELLALVAEGVLLKTGERRWSRYSLGSTSKTGGVSQPQN